MSRRAGLWPRAPAQVIGLAKPVTVRAKIAIVIHFDLLRHKTRQVGVIEREHEELVRVGGGTAGGIARQLERIGDGGEEDVVVSDEQGVPGHAVDDHILAEGQPLDLGREQVAVDTFGVELGNDVQEQGLVDGIAGQITT